MKFLAVVVSWEDILHILLRDPKKVLNHINHVLEFAQTYTYTKILNNQSTWSLSLLGVEIHGMVKEDLPTQASLLIVIIYVNLTKRNKIKKGQNPAENDQSGKILFLAQAHTFWSIIHVFKNRVGMILPGWENPGIPGQGNILLLPTGKYQF